MGRTKQSKSDNTPSPNAYQLPTTLGSNLVDKSSAPCYGVKSRPVVGGFSEDLQKTPGPGTYPTTDPNVQIKATSLYNDGQERGSRGHHDQTRSRGTQARERV